MAHMFAGGARVELCHTPHVLRQTGDELSLVAIGADQTDGARDGDAALLVPVESATSDSRDQWLLIGNGALRVNGNPIPPGIRLLQHRDELRLAGARAWFSTERLAVVEPLEDRSGPRCPRCSKEIAYGSLSAICPACSVAFHQSDRKPCFTYEPVCPICKGGTEIGGEFSFRPELL